MLPKRYRISKKNFKKVLQKGKSVHTDYFSLFYLDNNNTDNPKAGIIASTKVSKKATSRNKAKRVLRELIRLQLPKMKKSILLVGICKEKMLKTNFHELVKVLENILKTKSLYE